MATVTFSMPDGSSASADVSDGFSSLPQDQQVALIKQMQEQVAAQRAAAPKDRGVLSTLEAGAASTEEGLRNTAGTVAGLLPDGTPGKQTLASFGAAPAHFQTPKNYAPAMGDITNAIHQGHYLDALEGVPRAALEALPDVVGGLATGALATAAAPEALAGAAGALGAGAYMGARSFGDNVKAAAANNNHPTPTTGDVVRGGLTTIPEAALGAIGLKPGALPLVGKAIEGASPSVQRAAEVAAAGAGNAAMDATAQVGTSVGTDKGLQFDPSQTAAAALTGAGARGLTEVPGVVRDAATRATMRALGVGQGDMSVDRGQTVNAVAQAIQDTGEKLRAVKGRTPTADEVANTLHAELSSQLLIQGRMLRDTGILTPDEFRSDVEVALKQAGTHNRELLTGDNTDGITTALSRIESNPHIPDTFKTPMLRGLQDLNTLAEAARKNRGDGPFQTLLGGLGKAVGFGAAVVTGNPVDALLSFGGSRSIGGRIGASVGHGFDRLLGTNQPRVLLEQDQAQGALKKAGVEPRPFALGDIQTNNLRLQDPAQVARMALGIRPDTSGGRVNVAGPGEPPQYLTPAQIERSRNLIERGGAWMEQQLIAKARRQAALQRAQQKQVAALDAQAAAGAAQDSVALQQRVQQEARAKAAQMDAMARQNDAQRADEAKQQRQKEQAFQQAEAQAAALKTAQENQMAVRAALARRQIARLTERQKAGEAQSAVELMRMGERDASTKAAQMDAMARQNDAQQSQRDREFQAAQAQAEAEKQAQMEAMFQQAEASRKQDAQASTAQTRQEMLDRQRDLVVRQAILRKLRGVQRKDEANIERSNTITERVADYISGIAYRNSKDARKAGLLGAAAIGKTSPADIFEATNGELGSPEGPSDPLMVRADGSAVQAAKARAKMNPKAQEVAQRLAEAPPAPEVPSEAPVDSGGSSGIPEGGARYVQLIVKNLGVPQPTPGEITKAVGDLIQADLIPTDIGEAFLEHPHVRITSDLAKAISAQVLRNRGREDLLTHTAGTVKTNTPIDQQSTIQPVFGRGPNDAPLPNGGDRPIRNAGQFYSRRDANRAFEEAEAARFDASWPELARAIRQIAIEKEEAKKAIIRKAFLNGLSRKHGEPERRWQTAAQVLSGPLMKGI